MATLNNLIVLGPTRVNKLSVSGSTIFEYNVTDKGAHYFANGIKYYIDAEANAAFKTLKIIGNKTLFKANETAIYSYIDAIDEGTHYFGADKKYYININGEGNFNSVTISGDCTVGGTSFNDLKKSVSDGKSLVASAITSRGISTSSSDNFSTMAANIKNITILTRNSITKSGMFLSKPTTDDMGGVYMSKYVANSRSSSIIYSHITLATTTGNKFIGEHTENYLNDPLATSTYSSKVLALACYFLDFYDNMDGLYVYTTGYYKSNITDSNQYFEIGISTSTDGYSIVKGSSNFSCAKARIVIDSNMSSFKIRLPLKKKYANSTSEINGNTYYEYTNSIISYVLPYVFLYVTDPNTQLYITDMYIGC